MNAYKVELLIINHDNLSEADVRYELENVSYPNDCLSPKVLNIVSREIGEWTDNHPLNSSITKKEAIQKYFS